MPAAKSKAPTGEHFVGAKFHFTDSKSTKPTRPADPYTYQQGFGNQHASEAVTGTLPHGQNSPQNARFGLYTEQITGTAFVAPRHMNQHAWLYRVRPAVAHQGYHAMPDNPDTEACFLPLNPKVHLSPTQLAWLPFDIPEGNDVDFAAGIKTVAGSGEPTLREGIATHAYMCNKSMEDSAYVNSDGDYLIVPQQGVLDITTEFGKLWVEPGEICVIPRGLRFKVVLVDGPSRGYILEIWGSHFELPELGPLGSNGLANPRDFLYPTASYNLDTNEWKVIYKLGGKYFCSLQQHSPFDVVAWTGNYAPYKYDLTKFVNVGSISVDHIDPSVFTVLTAKSRDPAAPLTDVLIFSPRWDTASNTYRPPYYHRNVASELMGLIYGGYGGRSDAFQPGGLSYECGCVPHGVAYPEFEAATESELESMRISEGAIAFMFESSRPFTITDYAMKSKKLHEHDPKMWDDLVDNFSKHLKEVEAIQNGIATNGNTNGVH